MRSRFLVFVLALCAAAPATAQWRSPQEQIQSLSTDLGGVRAVVRQQRAHVAAVEAELAKQQNELQAVQAEVRQAQARADAAEQLASQLAWRCAVGGAVLLLLALFAPLRRRPAPAAGAAATGSVPTSALQERLVGIDARLRSLEQETCPERQN